MNMFRLKYYLSPDGEGGYVATPEGDKGEEAADIAGGTSGETGGETPERPRKPKVREDVKDTIINNYINTRTGHTNPNYPDAKIIHYFNVHKSETFIKPTGEKRKVTIKGEPGVVFSLTIKDSADCSILKEEIENQEMPIDGVYEFIQDFPSILTSEGASKTKETYDVKIIPAANVRLGRNVQRDLFKIDQYADPVVTVTNSFTAADIGGNIAVAGSDITITGPALTWTKYISNYSPKTYTLTVTESSSAAGYFYIKDSGGGFNENISASTIIKKVIKRDGETGVTNSFILKPLTTRTETSIEGDDFITEDVEVGMTMRATIEREKEVFASLDKDDNILDYSKCNTPTDKLQLLDINDLVPGMIVYGKGIKQTQIKSVDGDNKITLTTKNIIRKYTKLSFKRVWARGIAEVDTKIDASGNAAIKIPGGADIPDNTEVELDDNRNALYGRVTSWTGSGTDSLVLTTKVKAVRYGLKNVTYTLNLDNIVTRKPNAYNQHITIKKNSSGYAINMIKYDRDSNRTSKTGTVTRNPVHGSVGSYNSSNDTFTYTPHNDFTGEDSFAFTMSDGTNSSEEKIIRITIK